jgi:uncharacterized protein
MTITQTAPARPRLPLAARALLTVVAALAAAFSGYLATIVPAGAARTAGTYLCAAVAGLGLAVALVRGIDRRPVAALGLGRLSPIGCVVALVVTAASIVAGTLLAAAAGLTMPAPHVPATTVLASVPVMLMQAFLLQGFPEEVLFRGYLVQSALGQLPLWGVTALSALVFGVPHLFSGSGATTPAQRALFLLMPVGFALLATALRLRTGSVWPAVAVHGGFHVTWFVIALRVVPRPESLGAYFSVVGGVLLVVGLASAWWVAGRSRAESAMRPAAG